MLRVLALLGAFLLAVCACDAKGNSTTEAPRYLGTATATSRTPASEGIFRFEFDPAIPELDRERIRTAFEAAQVFLIDIIGWELGSDVRVDIRPPDTAYFAA